MRAVAASGQGLRCGTLQRSAGAAAIGTSVSHRHGGHPLHPHGGTAGYFCDSWTVRSRRLLVSPLCPNKADRLLRVNPAAASATDMDADLDEDEDEDEEEPTFTDALNAEFGVENMIMFSRGDNDLPRVWLTHPYSGMGLEIYLHGATITQWMRPNASIALNTHDNFEVNEDFSNVGSGLRLAFPQVREGTQMMFEEGFTGRLPWEVVSAGLSCLPMPDGLEGPGDFHAALDEYLALEAKMEADGTLWDEPQDPEAGLDALNVSVSLPDRDESEEDEEEGQEEGAQGDGEAQAQGEAPTNYPSQSAAAQAEPPTEAAAPGKKKRGRPKKSTSDPASVPKPSPPPPADSSTQQQQPMGVTGESGEQEGEQGQGEGPEGLPAEEQQAEDEQEEEWEGEDEEEDEEEQWERMAMERSIGAQAIVNALQEGLDPSPFITLRLRDNEQTRQIWPHAFELLYKISLQESDEPIDMSVDPEGSGMSSSMNLRGFEQDDVDQLEQRLANAKPGVIEQCGRMDPSTGEEVPVQVKLEIRLINRDEPGSPTMQFHMAALAQFLTADVIRQGEFVKILGLGGATTFDYSHDPRIGALMAMTEDYLYIKGQPIDTTFIGSCKSDVKVAPGDGTHFELIAREGFQDIVVQHPGAGIGGFDPNRKLVTIGAGRVATPKHLEAGEEWKAEFVVRWHNKWWPPPLWGDDGLSKLDPLPNKEFYPEGAVEGDAQEPGASSADES